MDFPTIVFVTLLLGAAAVLTFSIRYLILRDIEDKYQAQHRLEDEARRRTALRGNPRSVTRR